jgi:hypothetical protein
MLTVTIYLSVVGLGLLALPREAIAAIATPKQTPVQTVSGILGAVDGGAQSQGWFLNAKLASPMIVNMGALNLTWIAQNSATNTTNVLGVKLGVMNTTVNLICDGKKNVVLQLDTQSGDYSAKISRIGAQSDTLAARIEYTCGG